MITWMSRLFRVGLSIVILTDVVSAEAPQRTTDGAWISARYAAPYTVGRF